MEKTEFSAADWAQREEDEMLRTWRAWICSIFCAASYRSNPTFLTRVASFFKWSSANLKAYKGADHHFLLFAIATSCRFKCWLCSLSPEWHQLQPKGHLLPKVALHPKLCCSLTTDGRRHLSHFYLWGWQMIAAAAQFSLVLFLDFYLQTWRVRWMSLSRANTPVLKQLFL